MPEVDTGSEEPMSIAETLGTSDISKEAAQSDQGEGDPLTRARLDAAGAFAQEEASSNPEDADPKLRSAFAVLDDTSELAGVESSSGSGRSADGSKHETPLSVMDVLSGAEESAEPGRSEERNLEKAREASGMLKELNAFEAKVASLNAEGQADAFKHQLSQLRTAIESRDVATIVGALENFNHSFYIAPTGQDIRRLASEFISSPTALQEANGQVVQAIEAQTRNELKIYDEAINHFTQLIGKLKSRFETNWELKASQDVLAMLSEPNKSKEVPQKLRDRVVEIIREAKSTL